MFLREALAHRDCKIKNIKTAKVIDISKDGTLTMGFFSVNFNKQDVTEDVWEVIPNKPEPICLDKIYFEKVFFNFTNTQRAIPGLADEDHKKLINASQSGKRFKIIEEEEKPKYKCDACPIYSKRPNICIAKCPVKCETCKGYVGVDFYSAAAIDSNPQATPWGCYICKSYSNWRPK